MPSDAPPASITPHIAVSPGATLAAETRASLRSAYRPKPASGGGYSLVGSVPLEQLTPARTSVRTRRPRGS